MASLSTYHLELVIWDGNLVKEHNMPLNCSITEREKEQKRGQPTFTTKILINIAGLFLKLPPQLI